MLQTILSNLGFDKDSKRKLKLQYNSPLKSNLPWPTKTKTDKIIVVLKVLSSRTSQAMLQLKDLHKGEYPRLLSSFERNTNQVIFNSVRQLFFVQLDQGKYFSLLLKGIVK